MYKVLSYFFFFISRAATSKHSKATGPWISRHHPRPLGSGSAADPGSQRPRSQLGHGLGHPGRHGSHRGGPLRPPYRRWWCGSGRRAPGSPPAWTGARRAPGPAAAAARCAGRRSPGPAWCPARGSAEPGRRRRWSRWCWAPVPAPSSRCRCGPALPRSRWGRGRPWLRCARPVRPHSAPAATRAPPPPFRAAERALGRAQPALFARSASGTESPGPAHTTHLSALPGAVCEKSRFQPVTLITTRPSAGPLPGVCPGSQQP